MDDQFQRPNSGDDGADDSSVEIPNPQHPLNSAPAGTQRTLSDSGAASPTPALNPIVIPRWASLDWLQAAVGALVIIAGVILVSAVVRLLSGIGDSSDGPIFQQTLLFASLALGANIGEDSAFGGSSLGVIAVPFVLVTVVAAKFVADRFAAHIADDSRFFGYAIKTSLLTAVLSIAVGSLATIDFTRQFVGEASYTTTAGKGFVVSFLLVMIGTLLTRNWNLDSRLSRFTGLLGEPVRLAVTAYALAAGLAFFVLFVYAIARTDELSYQVLLSALLFVLIGGGTIAGGAASFSLGVPVTIPVELASDFFGSDRFHLLSEGVPLWAKFGVVITPSVVAVLTWRHLSRRRPVNQQALVRLAVLTGASLGIVSMLVAALSQVTVSEVGTPFGTLNNVTGPQISYDVGLALVLGLFWGWLGSFLAAAVWGKQNGMPIIVLTASPTP